MKNEKDWSAVVKVFGWLLQLATTLKKLASEMRVPFEAFLRLTTDKGETTLRAIVQLVLDEYSASLPKPPAMQGGAHYRDAAVPVLPPDHYHLPISYRVMPSLARLKEKWGKDNVSAIFDGRSFTLHASCEGMDRTPGEKTFYLHDAGDDWQSEEQIAWGLKQRNAVAPDGYRPATQEETHEFSEAHPELVDYVGLGAFAMDGGDRYVAFVWRCRGQRLLGHWFDGGWSRGARVLFVSK